MDLREKYGVNKNLYKEVICPVCGQITLDSFWICENCNWECDDPNISDDEESPPNHCTTAEYKEKISQKLYCLLQNTSVEGIGADVCKITKELRIQQNFLEQIVENDKKKRLSFDETKTKIRVKDEFDNK